MGFVKVVKTKAYFKRFQVKFRRRREGKTDYYARQKMIIQDKNKYQSPKYRLVVRFTNRDVICQIIAADLTHDKCLASAYAHELPRYGIKCGLTNYAAAYATGLLLARRVNAKFNLEYKGVETADGEEFLVEAEEDGARPFHAVLDVGLNRTSTGARVFGALKGAVDGGLNVPHNQNRFPGSKKEDGEWSNDPAVHRKYIFGGHVKEYMKVLKESDEEAYARQFAQYIASGINADQIEAVYKKAHAAIRADPNKKRDALEFGYFGAKRSKAKATKEDGKKKHWQSAPITLKQRKARVRQILQKANKSTIGPADE